MEEEKEKLLFCSYFRHISLWFYSNFDRDSSLDVKLNFASNKYPLDILLTGPATPKTRNTLKNKCHKKNEILLDEIFEFIISTCRIGSYWNGEIPLATETVKFHCFYDIGNYGYLAKGRYIKIIVLNGFVSWS